MVSRFKALGLLICLVFVVSGCPSFRVEKVTIGSDIPPKAAELQVGKTTLTEILSLCGAPLFVEDIGGQTLLVYEKKSYRGGQLTLGIPLSDMTATNASLNTYGRLWRYDTVGMVLDDEMILRQIFSTRGTHYPLWRSFWEDTRPAEDGPAK